MSLFRRLSEKLSEANSSLSSASKEWRDESLSARETDVRLRENAAFKKEELTRARVKEIQKLEARQSRRKWLYLLSGIAGAVPAFLFGILVGSMGGAPLGQIRADAVQEVKVSSEPSDVSTEKAPARTRYSDPYTALDQGKYGRGEDTNVGYYCLDVEATGDATFDECIAAVALVLSSQR